VCCVMEGADCGLVRRVQAGWMATDRDKHGQQRHAGSIRPRVVTRTCSCAYEILELTDHSSGVYGTAKVQYIGLEVTPRPQEVTACQVCIREHNFTVYCTYAYGGAEG